jgi:hypothetical protein
MNQSNRISTAFEQDLETLSSWHEYFRFNRENSSFVINVVWKHSNDVVAGVLGDALLKDLRNERPLVRHLEIALPRLGPLFSLYQSLFSYIATARLESITLEGSGFGIVERVSPTVSSRFLHTIQRNEKIRKLRINECCVPDLVWIDFLQNCSIEALEIDCNFVDPLGNSSPMNPIAAAFRDNGTIQEIYFDLNDETISSVLEIFKQLSHNTSIRYLSLEWSPSSSMPIQAESEYSVDIDTILALAKFIATSSSLRHIHLIDFEFIYIEPFLTALDENPLVRNLTFEKCRWDDASMTTTTYWMGRLRHIKSLQVDFCIPDQRNRDRMEQWWQVLRHNAFLQEIQWTPSSCAPSEEWMQRLLQRNRGVQSFLRRFFYPSLEESTGPNIPTVLLPHVVASLSECWHGPTWIFQALSGGRITAEYPPTLFGVIDSFEVNIPSTDGT